MKSTIEFTHGEHTCPHDGDADMTDDVEWFAVNECGMMLLTDEEKQQAQRIVDEAAHDRASDWWFDQRMREWWSA